MASQLDDEILADFLTEAGELVDQLDEQLIEMERDPNDQDLLNAVFRSFHTIKGGAGFLAVEPLVSLCHRAEDVFNLLRQQVLVMDAGLMDIVLQVVDRVKDMMGALREGRMPQAAPAELISHLEVYLEPDHAIVAVTPIKAVTAVADLDPIRLTDAKPSHEADQSNGKYDWAWLTNQEYERLLDALQDPQDLNHASVKQDKTSAEHKDDITEDEFEYLLDQLHGKGRAPGSTNIPAEPVQSPPVFVTAQGKTQSEQDVVHTNSARSETQDSTIRVDTRSLDTIMNLVGELVLIRNRMVTLRDAIGDPNLNHAASSLDLITADLQMAVMRTRMQPVRKVFSRFPRVVRDLARSLGKEVELELEGEDTGLDKNLVEALADPLVHLVRNAVDHGIELPEVRLQHGKSRIGKVILTAAQEGDRIVLTISDDGAGIDPEVIRAKAVEKGLLSKEAALRLDDHECFNLIFAPGFSTKSEISDVSGRGVGMDVVKTRISQLNGTVEVSSVKGEGSRITIRLPLTLAILPALMVQVAGRPFAVPLSSVEEILKLDTVVMRRVDGQVVAIVREHALPLLSLHTWMGLYEADAGHKHVVVAHVGSQRLGLLVDEVTGQEEVVIKSLGALLHGLPGYAGATITGDGRIALILDISGILANRAKRIKDQV
jgi:two-component system chemotaxis sensor kinase CheA